MHFRKTSIALAAMTLCGAAHAAPTNLAFRQPASNAIITKDINQSSGCELTGSGIVRAEFYLGGKLLNKEGSAPWNCNIILSQLQSGTYTLRGVAFASNGTSASKEISVTIDKGDGGSTTPPPPTTPPSGYTGTPYSGTPVALPKAFAAVDFDRGGQGVAYNDKTSGNAGGLYRSGEGVDIIAASGDPISAYAINGFQTGEWLAYTVNVPASGKYDLAIKAATNYSSPSSFHIEVDGVNVTGSVSVPKNGSWSSFQWVGKQGIDLAAGKRVLKVVADAEYFNLQAVSVLANSTTPPSTPPSEPLLPAVSFMKPLANATVSNTVSGSACEAQVTPNGSAIKQVQFYVDGAPLNLEMSAPYNCNFVTTTVLDGTRKLKAVATDMNGKSGSAEISVNVANGSSGGGSTDPVPPSGGSPSFTCSFENAPADCGFSEQAKVIGSRATLVSTAREGGKAVRLHTEPGDSNVNGSGSWERNDLSLGQVRTDCYEGKEQWWGHSVLFPSDYVVPNSGGVVMDFHHTGSSGQANFHVDAMSYGLRLRGYGGASVDGGRYEVTLGPVVRNQWYDFVYHVKWSSGSDGFMHAWVNGQKKLTHFGPTLYKGMGCYLKLANYHDPFGKASSVIHDRVRRGSSAADVSLTPLQ